MKTAKILSIIQKQEILESGNQIRKIRKNCGVKQKWLAHQLGISQPSLSCYERGQVPPPKAILYLIAFIFRLKPDNLLLSYHEPILPIWKSENMLLESNEEKGIKISAYAFPTTR